MNTTPSLTGRIWRWRARAGEAHRRVQTTLGCSPALAPVLASRGLGEEDAARAFFDPRLKDLADPSGLRDMERAVERIVAALERDEPMAVFGDYDVDGATSAALLDRYFRAIGVPVRVMIPNRLVDGYGPNPKAMGELAAAGIRLLITVDCGVSAFNALEEARRLGLEVVVTDHHQAHGELPPAVAVVDPNRHDDPFPHKELAGVGVVFYLVMALNRELRRRGWFQGGRVEPDLKQWLDLVAVGTIADVARLTGLNRLLVRSGLRQLNTLPNPGLAALIRKAGLRPGVGAGQVGFHMAPRINAGGRLGEGALGYRLLASDDPEEVTRLAEVLDRANQERQAIEQGILEQAIARVEGEGLAQRHRGVVVAGEGWHPGVVGIVASRLVERYGRPAVVFSLDGEGGGRASARSVAGVDLMGALHGVAGCLAEYGGHPMAAGLTLQPGRLGDFVEGFNTALERHDAALFQPSLLVDGALPLGEADHRLVAWLERLQPFGVGNPEPVFVLDGVHPDQGRPIKESHVKCRLRPPAGESGLEAIAFNVLPGPLGEALLGGGRALDVAGTLALNHHGGRSRLQFTVKDARLTGQPEPGAAVAMGSVGNGGGDQP